MQRNIPFIELVLRSKLWSTREEEVKLSHDAASSADLSCYMAARMRGPGARRGARGEDATRINARQVLQEHCCYMMQHPPQICEAVWQPTCAAGAHVAKMPRALMRARCSSSAAASAVPARASVPLPSSSTSTSASGPASSSTYLAGSVQLGQQQKF